MIAFLIIQILSSCREDVYSFIDNDPKELNDVDLTIARLRLYPHYKYKCPKFTNDLDTYDETLQEEYEKRTSTPDYLRSKHKLFNKSLN